MPISLCGLGALQLDSSWIVDSGASFHVTSRADYFSSYVHGDFGHVRMRNDGVSKIVEIRDICLKIDTGCNLLLIDVRHVPDIRLNLISTRKLDDEGFKSQFGNENWKLNKGSLIVASGKKNSTLYLLQAKLSKCEINVVEREACIEFGHISEKGMRTLARSGLLPEEIGTSL